MPLDQEICEIVPEAAPEVGYRGALAPERPKHYKAVCISLYVEDIERLEEVVRLLKARGYTKANKSAVIRFALDTMDIDAMPKGY